MQQQQTHQSQIRAEDLIFCYSEQNPETLVMLYPPQKIVQKMLKPIDPPYILWIIQEINEHFRQRSEEIQKRTSVKVITFSDIDKINDYLLQKKQLKKVIIICKPELSQNAKLLNRRKKISTLIEFPASQVEQDDYQNQLQNEVTQNLYVLQASNEDQLFQAIEDCCTEKPNYKQLMNFVAIRDDVGKSNVLVRTMLAMINQPSDLTTRKQIVSCFQSIANKTQNQNKLRLLIEELIQGPLTAKRALYWYTTNDISIYKIINNLLRSCSHPCEIFYLQPIFKDLFSAIQNMQKQTIAEDDFVCYRGGFVQKNQIEELEKNVGSIVKNLSFLSTSLSQQTALGFKKNTIFKILVPCPGKQEPSQFKFSYGFAKIKQVSQYAAEQEILFNPLCLFKVLEIKEVWGKNQYEIKLKYERQIKKSEAFSSISVSKQSIQREESVNFLGKLWKNLQKQIKSQGESLTYGRQSLQNGVDYWQKYTEIGIDFDHQVKGLIQLGRTLRNQGISSQTIFKKAMDLFQQKYGSPEIEKLFSKIGSSNKATSDLYYQIVHQLAQAQLYAKSHLQVQQICSKVMGYIEWGHNYYEPFVIVWGTSFTLSGQYEKAAELYSQCCEKQKKATDSFQNSDILISLAETYRNMGKKDEALKLCWKCSQMLLLTVGETHRKYINCLHVLAAIFCDSGNYRKSQQLYEKCCRLTKQSIGTNNLRYIPILNGLAFVQKVLGNYQGAQRTCETSLKICEKISNHSLEFNRIYVQSLNQLTGILNEQNNYQSALQKVKTSCQLSIKTFGENHPISLQSLHGLGETLSYTGRLKEGEQVMKKCCEIRLRTVGERHNGYINSLHILSRIYFAIDKTQLGFELLKKCQALQFMQDGESIQYISMLQSEAIEAIVLQQKKQYGQAVELFEKCHNVYTQLLGPSHKITINCLSLLGTNLYFQKDLARALDIFEKCYEIGGKVLGQTSDLSIQITTSLSALNMEMGFIEKAVQIQKKCCLVLQRQHNKYSSNIQFLINLLLNMGEHEDALLWLKQLIKLTALKDKTLIFRILYKLADINYRLGNYRKSAQTMEVLCKMRSRLRKNKTSKVKQQQRGKLRWGKQKIKLNCSHSFVLFEQFRC